MAITTAKGTQIKVGDAASPLVLATIGQVRSISGPTVKPNIVDITTHDTPGYWRRKIAVLIDPGTLGFDINFDAADVTHAFATGIWSEMIQLSQRRFQEVFPNAAGTLNFLGYYSQHDFNAPVDNVLSTKIQIDITDNIWAS